MRIVFHGLLKQLFGDEYVIQARSIAEAVEGFSRQVDWPRHVEVEIVGFREEKKIRIECPDEIHLMPALRGGGGKFLNIIIGAVMVVVGAVLFFTGINPMLGMSLMISGASMLVMGVINLFMKAPSMDKSVNPDDSKYLGINKNTTAARTPVTMAWGRVNLHPHWLSLQSDSNKLTHGRYPVTPT